MRLRLRHSPQHQPKQCRLDEFKVTRSLSLVVVIDTLIDDIEPGTGGTVDMHWSYHW